jgi:hypothetical protein
VITLLTIGFALGDGLMAPPLRRSNPGTLVVRSISVVLRPILPEPLFGRPGSVDRGSRQDFERALTSARPPSGQTTPYRRSPRRSAKFQECSPRWVRTIVVTTVTITPSVKLTPAFTKTSRRRFSSTAPAITRDTVSACCLLSATSPASSQARGAGRAQAPVIRYRSRSTQPVRKGRAIVATSFLRVWRRQRCAMYFGLDHRRARHSRHEDQPAQGDSSRGTSGEARRAS